jgi:hypothetical protein
MYEVMDKLLFIGDGVKNTEQYEDCFVNMRGRLIAIKMSGKYGFIDINGNLVVQFEYDDVYHLFMGGFYAVNKNKMWGFLDISGKPVIQFEYDDVRYFDGGFCAVQKNKKWGLINSLGQLVVKYQYDNAGVASEGLVAVKSGSYWGVIDTSGNVVVPFCYSKVDPFHCGLAPVCKDTGKRDDVGKWGFIDKSGCLIIPCQFSDSSYFENGVARVKFSENDTETHFIDDSGKVVSSFPYNFFGGFDKNGLNVAYYGNEDNEKYGVIDKYGRIIIPFIYDDMSAEFLDNTLIAYIKSENQYYVIEVY